MPTRVCWSIHWILHKWSRRETHHNWVVCLCLCAILMVQVEVAYAISDRINRGFSGNDWVQARETGRVEDPVTQPIN